MKIAFVMSTPFAFGGEQRVVSVISNILTVNKNNVDIICMEPNYEENYNLYNLDKRVKIINMPKNNILNKLQNIFFRFIRKVNRDCGILKNKLNLLEKFWTENYTKERLIKIINDNEYDVAIGVSGYNSIILAMIKENITAKVIGWQHNSFNAYFRNKGNYHYNQDKIFRKYVPILDEYIVLTNQDRKRMKEELGINCVTIYNPKSFISEKISLLNKKVFLAAGRFTSAKGFDLLIDSFKIFAEENKEWNLVIVGKGKEESKIKEKIKEYNLEERIQIDDFTDDIQKYFLNSACLLLPSRWEGMPMILLESMEMGVPVIAYKIPVVKEILNDEKDALLVNEFDINQYAEKMLKYVNDKQLRELLAKNIKDNSKNFSYEKIGENWEKILTKVKGK